MTELETNLTTETEQASEKKIKLSLEIDQESQSNCQGYLVDPVSKMHLCNACEYHKYRNENKPWLKKTEEQA